MANLRTVLWRVHNDCPGFVAREGRAMRISDVSVDLCMLREWARRALFGETPWMPPPKQVTTELLIGWEEDWLVEPREELRLLRLSALEVTSRRLLSTRRFGEAAGLARAAIVIDPLRESTNRLLIEIHLREGNRHEALRQLREYEQRLRALNIRTGPGPGITSCERHICTCAAPFTSTL